ncbi:MAG: PGPGW domain-containing protein [Verrucomicrobiota bacterium]|nr:PGPGW domain-containing protein [Verrucomicrobiota bacterium]
MEKVHWEDKIQQGMERAFDFIGVRHVPRVRKVLTSVIGFGVLAIGMAGVLLPLVPAFILIPAGLLILASEYEWARKAIQAFRERFQKARAKNHSESVNPAEGKSDQEDKKDQ